MNLSIILISLLNSRLISLKQENLARRWRTGWRFLDGFTSVSVYSRCSLCSYQAAQKNLVLHKKLLCQQKKIFHIEINVVQQNYMSHKKYVVATKKNKKTLCVVTTAMIYSNLASKFQYFRRPIYNPVEHL